MTRSDPTVLDAAELLPLIVKEAVVETVRDTHQAIARRAFGLVGAGTGGRGTVPRVVHDGISRIVYGSIVATLQAAHVGARVGRGLGPELSSPIARTLTSTANGFLGDRLVADGSPMALGTTLRAGGVDVSIDRDTLAAVFPEARPRIAVFVHGLAEHDQFWDYHRAEHGTTYPERLAGQGWTPVRIRYNTGLSLRENGVALSALMQQLVDSWPVAVGRIALVGHSMGGLVAHTASAVDLETGESRAWTDHLTDVVTLGAPHLGSDLARITRFGSRAAARLPETRAFATLLDRRSVGIADLADGLPELAPRAGVRYRLVSATLGASQLHPLGDLLVRVPSASARRRKVPLLPEAELLHVPHADHFDLLNHPDVHRALGDWLA